MMTTRSARTVVLALGAASLLFAGAGTLARTLPGAAARETAAAANTFKVDPVHSSMVFKIRHLGVANFYGRFDKMAGTFTFDPAATDTANIEATIETASIDTNNSMRDNDLKSKNYFEVETYPTITFKSKSVKKADGGRFDLTGELTMHGVTKPITAKLEFIGEKDAGARFGYRGGLEAQFTVKRSDFGMTTMIEGGGLGDEVFLIVSLEGMKQ
jgi:polyisoprenoid-binding protein YceI